MQVRRARHSRQFSISCCSCQVKIFSVFSSMVKGSMESGEAPASIAFCSGTVAAMVREKLFHQSWGQKTTLLMSSNNNDVMRLRAANKI